MPDNDTLYQPSTDITAVPVASDDIAGVRHQLIKVEWGPADSATQVADVDGQRLPAGGAQIGALTEAAPATDTASSGLNGRLQRIAQRLTALIAQLPATIGTKTAATSLGVTMASDDPLVAVEGTTADAAAIAGGTGTLSAKLRAISRDLVANIVLAAGTNVIGRVLRSETTATCSVPTSGGGQTGASVDLRGYTPIGIQVPSTFDGSQIQFEVSVDGSTWVALYDMSDVRIVMGVTVNRAYPLPGELSGWNYMRVMTVTAQTTTSTDFVVQMKA